MKFLLKKEIHKAFGTVIFYCKVKLLFRNDDIDNKWGFSNFLKLAEHNVLILVCCPLCYILSTLINVKVTGQKVTRTIIFFNVKETINWRSLLYSVNKIICLFLVLNNNSLALFQCWKKFLPGWIPMKMATFIATHREGDIHVHPGRACRRLICHFRVPPSKAWCCWWAV